MGLFKASLGGFVLGLDLSPLAVLIASRAGLLDFLGNAPHKKHSQPTPLAGGIR